jgi:hypothetical protein
MCTCRRLRRRTRRTEYAEFEATTSLDQMLGEVICWVESAIANGCVPVGRNAV